MLKQLSPHPFTHMHVTRTHVHTCCQAADFEWELGMGKTPNNGTGRHDMGGACPFPSLPLCPYHTTVATARKQGAPGR
jgi:hypothetical protein